MIYLFLKFKIMNSPNLVVTILDLWSSWRSLVYYQTSTFSFWIDTHTFYIQLFVFHGLQWITAKSVPLQSNDCLVIINDECRKHDYVGNGVKEVVLTETDWTRSRVKSQLCKRFFVFNLMKMVITSKISDMWILITFAIFSASYDYYMEGRSRLSVGLPRSPSCLWGYCGFIAMT